MIQILFSLIAAFQLSSASRLLLQSTPPFYAAPQQPAAPAQANPGNVAPANPAAPAQTAAPVYTTAAPAPSGQDVKCDTPMVMNGNAPAAVQPADSCALRHMDFTPQLPNFKLNCGGYGACSGSTYTIKPGYSAAAVGASRYAIEFCACKYPFSCYGSTFEFINPQCEAAIDPVTGFVTQPIQMEINDVMCLDNGSCSHAKFILDSRCTSIKVFDCENGCDGCIVYDKATGLEADCASYPSWKPLPGVGQVAQV